MGATARISPVKPPMVNTKIKPMANSMGVSKVKDPRHIVATQLNTFTLVGIEISMVAYMKYSCPVTGMPVANIWCAQTRKDRMAMAAVAYTIEADRKSTRLNSSHVKISYAVFCLKKKKKKEIERRT